MATTLRLRGYDGQLLANATPGTTDPAKDSYGRNVGASNVDYLGRGLIATARANSTAYSTGVYVQFAGGKLYKVTVGGTSAAAPPSETAGYGQTQADGTATIERIF